MKKKSVQRLEIVCLMLALTLISGCVSSSGNYANMRYDDQVKKTFESYIVSPEYNYFYTGPQTFPKAVVGISKDYTVESKLWNPIELTPGELRGWIYVQANRRVENYQRYGKSIVGPSGEHIGVWYSLKSWQQWARIELRENKVVNIGGTMDDKPKANNSMLLKI